jgi:predicted transcriptional regulator
VDHEIIYQLPDNCTAEEIPYRLYVVSKIERGEVDLARGKVVSHEQVVKDLREILAT